jgi:hypothetical protein
VADDLIKAQILQVPPPAIIDAGAVVAADAVAGVAAPTTPPIESARANVVLMTAMRDLMACLLCMTGALALGRGLNTKDQPHSADLP